MNTIHLMNLQQRNARVAFRGLRHIKSISIGLIGNQIEFRRYLASSETGTHEHLTNRFGDQYSEVLINSDPEIDFELVGKVISETSTVYLSNKGEVMHVSPEVIDVIYGPDGSEKEKKAAEDLIANVKDDMPVRLTGRKMAKQDVVRRFSFRRSVQLQHTDGLTYDFLYDIAKQLHHENSMILVGAGDSGKEPLILQTNGTPYRGFLEGRIEGLKYQLFLHLSNMELKIPQTIETPSN